MNCYRALGILVLVAAILVLWPSLVLAQDQFPNVPDNTVDVVQLWMIAFGILTTAIASLMRILPIGDLPDLAKKLIVVVISVILAAVGLAVNNHLFPEAWIRASLTIIIVASGIYALLGKTIQDGIAGVKTIAVAANTNVDRPIQPSEVVDPGH